MSIEYLPIKEIQKSDFDFDFLELPFRPLPNWKF